MGVVCNSREPLKGSLISVRSQIFGRCKEELREYVQVLDMFAI